MFIMHHKHPKIEKPSYLHNKCAETKIAAEKHIDRTFLK
jgi:hypothetical protein